MKQKFLIILCFISSLLHAQSGQQFLYKTSAVVSAKPLETLAVAGKPGAVLKVYDGKGQQYVSMPMQAVANFITGGALGRHTLKIFDAKGKLTDSIFFTVDASTSIDDGGYYKNMFDLFYSGMNVTDPKDKESITWDGKTYRYFAPWGLDHYNIMKGLKYFRCYGAEFVDLMRTAQREDGMIYSFVQHMDNMDYFLTRDKFSGYSKKIGDRVFVRQPTENHPEYIYVNTIYQCWKAKGDDAWMKKYLSSASRALNYTLNDPARWSKRFQLLKRVYTIDSWDFEVEDEYLPDIGLTNTMIIDPVKSKFGVFFGDNTGYINACYELAEMYNHVRMQEDAKIFTSRAKEIRDRLDALAWNGKFFTHFIDEDPTVIRKLGVDEKSQIAQSNAYSLNRNITHKQSKAIIETYLNLKNNLPVGSPGEWYAIYPPFQKGFGIHDEIWQYMNGGVGGHVAGELSRGAYENGYESYGTDILNRLFELGKKYDNKIWFAYTGSIPPPPVYKPPVYKPLDITAFANMDNWDKGSETVFPWMNSKGNGDDLHELPVGEQNFAGIRFNIIDAAKNNRKAVVALSRQKDFPATVEIPVNDTAACIYMLHTSSKPASENVAGAVSFVYADGSQKTNYMMMDKQLTSWWFSRLKTDYSGIAWYGESDASEGVGLSWCAINNPEPSKTISKIILHAPENNGIYSVFGITLSNQKHYVPVNPVSFGGPDNWAAATAMAAMVEGLSGIKNALQTEAFSNPVIAPRWVTSASDTVNVTIRYAASKGYVTYHFIHDKNKKQLQLMATGSGENLQYHILLPEKITAAKSVLVNNKPVMFTASSIEQSVYIDFTVKSNAPQKIVINY